MLRNTEKGFQQFCLERFALFHEESGICEAVAHGLHQGDQTGKVGRDPVEVVVAKW